MNGSPADEASGSSEDDDAVVFEMLRSWYYDDTVASTIATWIMPTIIWFAIGNSTSGPRFAIWAIALGLATSLLLLHRRSAMVERRWIWMAFSHELAAGMLWGSVMLIAPPNDVVDQMFIAVVLVSVVMGAAIAMGQFFRLFFAFAMTTTATSLIGFWLHAPDVRVKVTFVFAVLLAFGMSVAAQGSQGHQRLARALRKNESLAEDLAGRNDALHEANGRLDQLARTDALTGLHNRRSFDLLLQEEMRDLVTGGQTKLALAYLDLDRFKAVNDKHGHRVGDKLLQIFAERLRGAALPAEHVARIGGDEFVLMSANSCANELGERLVERLVRPVVVDGIAVDVGVSIGIAFTQTPTDPEVLVRRADIALYDAKFAGGQQYVVAADPIRPPERSEPSP